MRWSRDLGASLIGLLSGMCGSSGFHEARADDPARLPWAVLPVRSPTPPPQDPTLLRLTKEVGAAVHKVVTTEVRVVSRELRDDACPSPDAQCPRNVADLLHADKVLSLYLEKGLTKLELRIYSPAQGLEQTLETPCKWAGGNAECELDQLVRGLVKKPQGAGLSAEEAGEVFQKIHKRLVQCKKRGWGNDAPKDKPNTVQIQLRVGADGRAKEVRLPKGLADAPAYSCMAREVEALHFPKRGKGSDGPLSFDLPVVD